MNIHEELESNLKYISKFNGMSLNIEEKFKLEIALNNLHLNIKSDEMWFWGKIIGIEKDYYVAVALFYKEYHLFPKKKFFFCNSSNFFFSELPEVMEYHVKDAIKFNTYFIGNPDVILESFDEADSYNNDSDNNMSDNEDHFKPHLKKKNFTESDRLAFLIRTIDYDCCIVPEGSFKMLPISEVRRNDNFTGIF